MGHFLKTELNQTIFIKGWDAITYPYPNFNGDLTKSYPTEKNLCNYSSMWYCFDISQFLFVNGSQVSRSIAKKTYLLRAMKYNK